MARGSIALRTFATWPGLTHGGTPTRMRKSRRRLGIFGREVVRNSCLIDGLVALGCEAQVSATAGGKMRGERDGAKWKVVGARLSRDGGLPVRTVIDSPRALP